MLDLGITFLFTKKMHDSCDGGDTLLALPIFCIYFRIVLRSAAGPAHGVFIPIVLVFHFVLCVYRRNRREGPDLCICCQRRGQAGIPARRTNIMCVTPSHVAHLFVCLCV